MEKDLSSPEARLVWGCIETHLPKILEWKMLASTSSLLLHKCPCISFNKMMINKMHSVHLCLCTETSPELVCDLSGNGNIMK